jgi:hypothetical protein
MRDVLLFKDLAKNFAIEKAYLFRIIGCKPYLLPEGGDMYYLLSPEDLEKVKTTALIKKPNDSVRTVTYYASRYVTDLNLIQSKLDEITTSMDAAKVTIIKKGKLWRGRVIWYSGRYVTAEDMDIRMCLIKLSLLCR